MKFSDFLLNCDNCETLKVFAYYMEKPIVMKCEDFLFYSKRLLDREIKTFFSWIDKDDKDDTDSHIEVYLK